MEAWESPDQLKGLEAKLMQAESLLALYSEVSAPVTIRACVFTQQALHGDINCAVVMMRVSVQCPGLLGRISHVVKGVNAEECVGHESHSSHTAVARELENSLTKANGLWASVVDDVIARARAGRISFGSTCRTRGCPV